MKINRWLYLPILFSVSLLASLWSGYAVGATVHRFVTDALTRSRTKMLLGTLQGREAPVYDTPESLEAPIERQIVPTSEALLDPEKQNDEAFIFHQRNVLVIGVDDLQAPRATLEGIWMIVYMFGDTHFIFVPIYPATSPLAPPDMELARQFELGKTKTPGAAFLEALQAKDLWWSGYILLDRTALQEIRGIVTDQRDPFDKPSRDELVTINREASSKILEGQARFVQELCRSANQLSDASVIRLMDLPKHLSTHFRTDLNLIQATREIQAIMNYKGGITCEFPSLANMTATP